MILQLLRRAMLSVGIAGAIASTLRTVGMNTSTEFQTGGWRDVTDEELRASSPDDSRPTLETIDLTVRASEIV